MGSGSSSSCTLAGLAAQTRRRANFSAAGRKYPQHLQLMPGLCFSNSSQKPRVSENTKLEYMENRKAKMHGGRMQPKQWQSFPSDQLNHT